MSACRVDGILYDLCEEIKLEKNKKHNIEIVVDRLVVRPDITRRLTDSVETASNLSGGLVVVNVVGEEQDILFSQNYACEDCGMSIEELTPRMFSFNNPFGACPTCTGLGMQLKADPELIMPDKTCPFWRGPSPPRLEQHPGRRHRPHVLRGPGQEVPLLPAHPGGTLPEEVQDVILYGTGGEKLELHYDQPRGRGTLYQPFEGVANNLERRYQETQSDASKRELEECMSECPCPTCQGRRLRPEALAVTVGELDIDAISRCRWTEALDFWTHWS